MAVGLYHRSTLEAPRGASQPRGFEHALAWRAGSAASHSKRPRDLSRGHRDFERTYSARGYGPRVARGLTPTLLRQSAPVCFAARAEHGACSVIRGLKPALGACGGAS